MSSRGMTQAQIEARRRELERKQEESRRRKVKQQITALADNIERVQRGLAQSGTAAWVQEEIREIMAAVNNAKDTPASGNIDAAFNEMNAQYAKLSNLTETSELRKDALQREQWMAESAVIGLKLELEARLEDVEGKEALEQINTLIRRTEDLSATVRMGQINELQNWILFR